MGVDMKTAFALVRRYAEAIAEGRIEAKKVASMTDEELEAFDDFVFGKLEDTQSEAEELATPVETEEPH